MSTGIQHNSHQSINWQGETISVISLGCDRLSALTPQAIEAIRNAEVIFGGKHHFDEIASIETNADKVLFPSPFSELPKTINQYKSSRLCVLASGDALFFGVGSWLIRNIGTQHLNFHPNISSIQACFHAIGMPWQDAKIVSLHGRPLSALRSYLINRGLLAILTDNSSNPVTIANELNHQGFGDSIIWVCEAMGSSSQQISRFKASELAVAGQSFQALNVCIVTLEGNTSLPAFPGIADALFSTGSAAGFGMISKREVRLSILSLMQPTPGEVAWDIGAGCGSVSVEWARWNSGGRIYAIESLQTRIDHIKINAGRFGTTQNLNIVEGNAPDCCTSLPQPDCIFIGGSNGLSPMLDYAWRQLKPGGKLVASAVTEDSRDALITFMSNKPGFEQVDIQITKNLPGSLELRTLSPVQIAKCIKPPVISKVS
jgi:precorrin-6Y C5,15-methyltransferase (decarboxylating)